MSKITIVDYGLGNLRSINKKLHNFNINSNISDCLNDIKDADILILPGIGSFKKAIQKVKKNNVKNEILDHINKKNKLLIGICLGMQMFFSNSDEFGHTKGLNLIKGSVKKFDKEKLITPHTGWNSIKILKKNDFIKTKELKNTFYFTHSFYCKPTSKEFTIGETNYSNFKFCSIVKKNNICYL